MSSGLQELAMRTRIDRCHDLDILLVLKLSSYRVSKYAFLIHDKDGNSHAREPRSVSSWPEPPIAWTVLRQIGELAVPAPGDPLLALASGTVIGRRRLRPSSCPAGFPWSPPQPPAVGYARLVS